MKTILSLVTFCILFGCNTPDNVKLNTSERIDSIQVLTKPKNLNFSLSNNTSYKLYNILIGLPDTLIIRVDSLMPKTQTKWIPVHSAYRYCALRIEDHRDSIYYYTPIDYVGEELYDTGRMTYVIEEIDTINLRIKLSHKYE